MSMGFWRPAGQDMGSSVRLSLLAYAYPVPNAPQGLTKIGFLQKHLCKGPADATNERSPQHQGKALHVELCGLIGKHEEAPSNEQDHQDQGCTLEGGQYSSLRAPGSSTGHVCIGGQQPSFYTASPPGPGPLTDSRLTRRGHVPNTILVMKHSVPIPGSKCPSNKQGPPSCPRGIPGPGPTLTLLHLFLNVRSSPVSRSPPQERHSRDRGWQSPATERRGMRGSPAPPA